MKTLTDRILSDGLSLEGGILKVDSFLNHQIDPQLMYEAAEEFARLFDSDGIGYDKIVTIEASGIAPAVMLGYIRKIPVVFIKKKRPKTMENMLETEVRSFTKGEPYTACISRDFLRPGDRVLFIDDFLACGNAALGMIDLARQAGATVEGMGFVIEKGFQGGGDRLRGMGYRIHSLAVIKSLDNCKITLQDD